MKTEILQVGRYYPEAGVSALDEFGVNIIVVQDLLLFSTTQNEWSML